jgi:hypothetical protein
MAAITSGMVVQKRRERRIDPAQNESGKPNGSPH